MRGPQDTHMKNFVQLNGNGAISPSAQPVGMAGKSQVADGKVDVANVVGTSPEAGVGSNGLRTIGCWLCFAFALAIAGWDRARRTREKELNDN